MASLYQSLLALISSITLLLPIVSGASLQQVTRFGTNPTNVGMYIYVPDQLAPNPPILVNPHACHGSAQTAYTGSQYATLASKYGFIVIYPDSPNTIDKCWDVSSSQTLSHNGGGDSLGIVSMVKWTLAKYNGNPNRVFVTGTSSGAMMTNVLCGAYPDIFAAGSAFAGVAFGCFAGNGYDVWNGDCANGLVIKTGAEWEAIVLAAYPGYTGYRPKMQVFHGTADTTLYPQNLQEEIKEWTAVLGLPSSPVQTIQNSPLSGWTEYIYGSTFQAYSAAGVTHDIPTQENVVMAWFDLTCTSNTCFSRTGGSSPPPPPSSTPISPTSSAVASSKTTLSMVISSSTASTRTTLSTITTKSTISSQVSTSTAPASSGMAVKWGQCGGIGYTGPTICGPGAGTCHYSNPYYSQCF